MKFIHENKNQVESRNCSKFVVILLYIYWSGQSSAPSSVHQPYLILSTVVIITWTDTLIFNGEVALSLYLDWFGSHIPDLLNLILSLVSVCSNLFQRPLLSEIIWKKWKIIGRCYLAAFIVWLKSDFLFLHSTLHRQEGTGREIAKLVTSFLRLDLRERVKMTKPKSSMQLNACNLKRA